MHHESNPAGRPTPTTFVLHFTAGDNAHLAADRLEQLGFRAVVTWLDAGQGWQVEAGALTSTSTEAGALDHVQRVADRYQVRVDHAHGGWQPGNLELVRPGVEPRPREWGELSGLWTRLIEATANNDPSPVTTLCAEWAAGLERRFPDWEPPNDGWITLDLGSNGGRP